MKRWWSITVKLVFAAAMSLVSPAFQNIASGQEAAEACTVPEAPAILERAICEGTARAFTQALLDLKEAETSPTFLEVLPLLDRVWSRDARLGKGVDWRKLDDPYLRADLVYSLAPQVILGRSKVPLRELQQHAIELSREDVRHGGSMGIHLLGVTHTPGQVEFLTNVAQSSSSSESQRMAAIYALGGLCEAEAATVLETLRADSRRTDEERRAASRKVNPSSRVCSMAGFRDQ